MHSAQLILAVIACYGNSVHPAQNLQNGHSETPVKCGDQSYLRWYTPIILALEKLKQQFEASLGFMRTYLQNKNKKNPRESEKQNTLFFKTRVVTGERAALSRIPAPFFTLPLELL